MLEEESSRNSRQTSSWQEPIDIFVQAFFLTVTAKSLSAFNLLSIYHIFARGKCITRLRRC